MVNKFIEKLFSPTGLPIAYRFFKPKKNKPVPEPPYLVYLIKDESGYGADEKNLISNKSVTVELYSDKKSFDLEATIEEIISAYEYRKHEEFIESEEMWQVSYEFEIYEKLGGIRNE